MAGTPRPAALHHGSGRHIHRTGCIGDIALQVFVSESDYFRKPYPSHAKLRFLAGRLLLHRPLFTDRALDLDNDGTASTNLNEEWYYDKNIYDFKAPEHYSAIISDGKGNIQANFCLPVQSRNAEGTAEPKGVKPLHLQYTCTETEGTNILLKSNESNLKNIKIVGMERIGINVFRLDFRLTLYDFKTQQWVETDAWGFFFSVI